MERRLWKAARVVFKLLGAILAFWIVLGPLPPFRTTYRSVDDAGLTRFGNTLNRTTLLPTSEYVLVDDVLYLHTYGSCGSLFVTFTRNHARWDSRSIASFRREHRHLEEYWPEPSLEHGGIAWAIGYPNYRSAATSLYGGSDIERLGADAAHAILGQLESEKDVEIRRMLALNLVDLCTRTPSIVPEDEDRTHAINAALNVFATDLSDERATIRLSAGFYFGLLADDCDPEIASVLGARAELEPEAEARQTMNWALRRIDRE